MKVNEYYESAFNEKIELRRWKRELIVKKGGI